MRFLLRHRVSVVASFVVSLVASGLLVAAAHAAPASIDVVRADASPSLAGGVTGTATLTLHNTGSAPDHLVSATSPAAGSVEIHQMTMKGEVMSMRRVDRLPIAAGQTVHIDEDAGLHVMLIDLKRPLKSGDAVPLTLTFEKAGKIETVLKVRPAGSGH